MPNPYSHPTKYHHQFTMLMKGHQIKVPMILNLIIVLVFYVTAPVNGLESRKLGDTTVPATKGTDEECTPCGNTYTPPPPPPELPPPSPPPPAPKKTPPKQYCPPPPSSFIYITGPPGNLYPVDENFSGVSYSHQRNFATFLLPLLVGFISMIAFW